MLCSGIKECITVKQTDDSKEKIQKRLILTDLKDLYGKWKQETAQNKIRCLAFFVSLKPKQCFYAGDPGPHNICVCAIHQNFKLKLSAVRPDILCKEFLASGVCSMDNKQCMFNKCSECPGKEGMKIFLLAGLDVNVESSKTILNFMQWTKVDDSGGEDNKKMERVSLKELSKKDTQEETHVKAQQKLQEKKPKNYQRRPSERTQENAQEKRKTNRKSR